MHYFPGAAMPLFWVTIMKVWIVMEGEQFEGGSFLEVFDSELKAAKYVAEHKEESVCDWMDYTEHDVK